MEENIDKIIPEDKYLSIGNKTFKIWISAERSLKAAAMFNKFNEEGSEERGNIKNDYDFYIAMLDVAFLLIKQDFNIHVFDWIKRELLTKKYILKHLDIKELGSFVEDALEPIIGTKKKELAMQEKAAEAMMIVMETISKEALAQLLQNSLQGVDIKKVM